MRRTGTRTRRTELMEENYYSQAKSYLYGMRVHMLTDYHGIPQAMKAVGRIVDVDQYPDLGMRVWVLWDGSTGPLTYRPGSLVLEGVC